MIFLFTLGCIFVVAAPPAAAQSAAPEYHLSPVHRARIQAALGEGVSWLVEHRRDDGAFQSRGRHAVPPLPLTAMALWALSTASDSVAEIRARSDTAAAAAASYLLSFQQGDGGIYDPAAGLVRYTAAISRQALEAWNRKRPDPRVNAALERLNLFVYRHRELESVREEELRPAPGTTTTAIDKLRQRKDLTPNLSEAVELLWRARRKPTGRQHQARRARQIVHRLHQALAKRVRPGQHGAIVVLQRAGHDLRRRG